MDGRFYLWLVVVVHLTELSVTKGNQLTDLIGEDSMGRRVHR